MSNASLNEADRVKIKKQILTYLLLNEYLSLSELSKLINVPNDRALTLLRELIKKGLVSERISIVCDYGHEIPLDEYGLKEDQISTLISERDICPICGHEFYINEENIIRYFSLTILGRSVIEKEMNFTTTLIPKLNILEYYTDKLYDQYKNILEGICFIVVLHFLRDLIPFLKSLVKLGANPNKCFVICKPYPYRFKDQIYSFLQIQGFNVLLSSSIDELFSQIRSVLNLLSKLKEPLIIIEDGGYVTYLMHKEYPTLLHRCRGVVEQTTKGIIRLTNELGREKLKVPIYNVAQCALKQKYEPKLIADAVVRNIDSMVHHLGGLRGREVLVVGYGNIGSEIAKKLRNNGVATIVVDKDPGKLAMAKSDGFIAYNQIQEALSNHPNIWMIIGCTGRCSINRHVIPRLPSQVVLVSASSDQDEIDIKEIALRSGSNIQPLNDPSGQRIGTVFTLERLKSQKVFVLADGYPINFYSSESVPNRLIDPILTLLFLSVIEIVRSKRLEPGLRTSEVDELVVKYEVEQQIIDVVFT